MIAIKCEKTVSQFKSLGPFLYMMIIKETSEEAVHDLKFYEIYLFSILSISQIEKR